MKQSITVPSLKQGQEITSNSLPHVIVNYNHIISYCLYSKRVLSPKNIPIISILPIIISNSRIIEDRKHSIF